MHFDNIISNPPYGSIGVDIVSKIMYDVPHNDISILGTRAMLCKHNKHLALEYVYIERYTLSPAPLNLLNIVNTLNTEAYYHNKTSCNEEEMPTNERVNNGHFYCSILPVSTYCNVVILEENQ